MNMLSSVFCNVQGSVPTRRGNKVMYTQSHPQGGRGFVGEQRRVYMEDATDGNVKEERLKDDGA